EMLLLLIAWSSSFLPFLLIKYFYLEQITLVSFTEINVFSVFSKKEAVQKEVKASLSQKASLSCTVSDSKTEVKWYKDGKQLISSRTVYSEVKGNTRLLVMEKVEKSDAGEYTCEAGGEKLFRLQVEVDLKCFYDAQIG
uniref:Obscurin, cytoskeletal calmodulin and titin-interacting RhoGEF b n=1 Tax=Salarias fasciatus TaxID=181472 RepID=A0A672FB83_SALFA